MTLRFAIVAACLAMAPLVAIAEEKIDPAKMTKTASGLHYKDSVEGKGKSPAPGQTCVMHYTGWLWENGRKGKKFDSSRDGGTPFSFAIGNGEVIKIQETGQPGVRLLPGDGSGIRHFQTGKGEAIVMATDAAGNSTNAPCR